MAAMQSADVVFYSGLMLEGKMADALVKVSRKKPVYDEEEIAALAAYVASLGPGPAIPSEEDYSIDGLSEEDATEVGVTDLVLGLLAAKEPTVVCTHRPVIPLVLATLGVTDPGLDPAGMLVVHHRRGQVLSLEHHVPHEPLQV